MDMVGFEKGSTFMALFHLIIVSSFFTRELNRRLTDDVSARLHMDLHLLDQEIS
jgi:hypothetical protein